MDTDRNLLFGVLAFQGNLIDSKRFAEACSAWAAERESPLADLLVDRGWLTFEQRGRVEILLDSELRNRQDNGGAVRPDRTSDYVSQSLDATTDSGTHDSPDKPASTPSSPGHVLLSTSEHGSDSRDRYTLTRLHATGGIGRVWLAHDPRLGRDVALKELLPERAGRPETWARFLKEAQVTGQLEHPGIVPIYEVGQRPDDRVPFYTMRFVRGRTLAEAAAAYHARLDGNETKPSELRELIGAFVGVCNAVAYAHSRGVIHRDLKPQNIVLGDFGEVIVLDWGLARLNDSANPEDEQAGPSIESSSDIEATSQGQILGTPAYMAPEQAEGNVDLLGPTTDVYGLGAILYEILTGRAPFGGAQTQEVLRRVLHEPPTPPRSLSACAPRPLEAICLKALSKKPQQRYQTAKELAGDVQRWLADESVSAYREPLTVRAARWVKRHRLLVTSSAAAMLVALAGLGVVLAQEARANRALTAKNEELATKNEELAAANRRVEARFALAEDAIKTYHTGVSEDFMLREKNLTPLRKKLLASARTFYTRLEGELQGQNDRASREALARAYRSIARLTFEVDSLQAGLSSFRQALTLQRALVAEEGAGPDATADLAEMLTEMLQTSGSQLTAADKEAAGTETLSLTRGLVERNPGVERYDAALAKCLTWRGALLTLTASPTDALKAYQEAGEIYQRLVQAHPKNLDYLNGLAISAGGVGSSLRKQGRAADGEAAIKRSIALLEQLAQAEPGNALYQNIHAQACVNYGGGFGNSRVEETLVYFRKAQGIWVRTLAEYPNSLFLLNNVAFIHDRVAKRLCVMDLPQEEAAAYERESAAYERAAQADSSTPMFPNEVADSQEILSVLYARAGRKVEALAAGQRAVAIREELARTHPDFQPDRLPVCYLKLGDLLTAAGRGADASGFYEKALAAYLKKGAAEGDKPTASTLRGRGGALQRLGRTAEAAKAFQDALAVLRDSKAPNYWFDLARTRALLAGIAPEPGSGLTPDEAETHAAEAVKALRRYVAGRYATVREAADAGYVDVNYVDKQYQLDSLRTRADFQELLREMRAQKQ
jgi:serine/threonine-protein kinase